MTTDGLFKTNHTLQSDVQNSSSPHGCMEVRHSEMQYLPWDNPDNIVSAAVEMYTRKTKNILIGFLFLIGGPANVINVAVFCKQGLKDRVNLCLFSLSLTDGLYLTTAMLLHGESIYLHLVKNENNVPANEVMTNNNLIVFMGLAFVSQVLSAIIACERCYCVFRPLKYQTVLRTRTMAAINIAVYVLVLGVFFIVAFRYRVGCIYDPETKVVVKAIVAGTFYRKHKDLIDFLDGVVFGAGFPGGTMVVVMIATILTAFRLHQVMTWRTETTSSSLSPREVSLTKMLIGNSVFFIVCISPSCVFRVVSLFLREMRVGGRQHNFYTATLWICSGFCLINSTFNFFIYYAMGSRYRQTFWTLFGRRVTQKNDVKSET